MEFESFGLHLTVQDRSEAEGVVKRAFIKEDSFDPDCYLLFPYDDCSW